MLATILLLLFAWVITSIPVGLLAGQMLARASQSAIVIENYGVGESLSTPEPAI